MGRKKREGRRNCCAFAEIDTRAHTNKGVCWHREVSAQRSPSVCKLLERKGEKLSLVERLGIRTSTKICTGCVFKTERSFQPRDREIFIDGVKISSVFINELIQYAKRNCWKTFIRSSSTFILLPPKKKKRNWTASIKVNKKIRLCTKQILTTRLVIVKFFPLLRKHPFTLPDNLTICKIASPPGWSRIWRHTTYF